MSKIMEVKNKKLKIEHSRDVNVYTYNYDNNDLIAGEFNFKTHESRSRHSIMLASRFNKDSREENPPFPGWFVQIVGTSLSIGIGNGKTWLSIVSTGQIIDNEWNHVSFSIDNKTKKGFLYLNGHCTSKDNITFRKPCNLVTTGALNKKGEFKFAGELSDIIIGTELVEKETVSVQESESIDDIESYIIKSDNHIKVIKNNVSDLENDIVSLEEIKSKILSWKYRGLEFDTTLLDNQINRFVENKHSLEEETKKQGDTLFELDYKINRTDESVDKSNYLDFYGTCLHNLKGDVDILNNAVEDLSNFTKLGIELGNAFEKVEEQKDYIKDQMIQANEYLENMEKITFDMMNIVTIDEE
jgi:hypothetical protein